MKKNETVGLLTAIFAMYLASVATAFANPAHLRAHQVSISVQAATAATLVLSAPLVSPARASTTTALLAVIGASLAARLLVSATAATDLQTPWTVRWDAFATSVGLLAVTGLVSYELGGALATLGAVLICLPLVLALPRISSAPLEHQQLLQTSLRMAKQAYKVSGTGDFVNDPPTGTLAGVDVDGGDTYVFFSGTTTSTDWLRVNADFVAQEMPAAWTKDRLATVPHVHRGFLRSYTSIREALWGKIQEHVLRVGGSGRIVCCGHSLGGALATLACLDLACRLDPEDVPKLCCVTFGAPQVGDGAFVHAFDALIPLSLRVAAVYDPVPRLLSAQFPHVKGLVAVASPIRINKAHDIGSYAQELTTTPGRAALVMAMPALLLGVTSLVLQRL